MLLNCLLLALSSSIDSFGIGITYGIKNTKIYFLSKVILFIISFVITSTSVLIGNYINQILPAYMGNLIGNLILIFIAIIMIFKSFLERNKKQVNHYDFDHSNFIDPKEAVILGLALSLDSFGIGISSSLIGANSFFFPLLVSTFQFLFLSLGNLSGRFLRTLCQIPDLVWSIFSALLLILIAIFRFF